MEPIALMIAGLMSAFIGSRLAPETTVKSDSYALSQIREVVSAMDKEAEVTGIETKISITINNGEKATLYDLNNDEGYLVLGDNYKIFDFQKNVGLNERASRNKCAFNPISRSFMTDGEQYVSVVDEPTNGQDMCKTELKVGAFEDNGCGKITSGTLNEYIDNKFPGGELDDECSIPITRQGQFLLSVYLREIVENGVPTGVCISEGNCGLCAAYTIFHYLANDSAYKDISFGGFPKQENKTAYYPRDEEPETYYWVLDNLENCHIYQDYFGTFKAKEFDNLYIALRKKGLELKPLFPITDGSVDDVIVQLESVAHQYGLASFDAMKDTNFNAFTGTQEFKNFLKGGKPLFFASHGSTYGNHAMAVSGFKHYKRTVKVLFWDKIEWATFLEIGDGHSLDTMYFDITRYYWENCGSGEFIKYVW